MERLVEQDRTTRVGEPERDAEAWALRMPGTTGGGAMPTRHQQAAGGMTLEELGARLKGLESARASASLRLSRITDVAWRRSRRTETPC